MKPRRHLSSNLNYESNTEPEHFLEKMWFRPNEHCQVDQKLLQCIPIKLNW